MLTKVAELIITISEAMAWAEASQSSDEMNWEMIRKCNESKKQARHILESILSDIET